MQYNNSDSRYERHLQLRGFGAEAQEKLSAARVLVIGVGGLGCPALQYLASNGVGTLGIVDFDVIDITNLHRQIFFNQNELGELKTIIAEKKIKEINPSIKVITYNCLLTNKNILPILSQYDVVLDCTDNFAARYIINDACVLSQKPLIYAGIYEYEAQVAVWNVAGLNGFSANYRDLFPEPPKSKVPSCSEAGVLGVLPGWAGIMMAIECIKLITSIGVPLINQILTFNLLTQQTYNMQISPGQTARLFLPADEKEFTERNYYC